MIDETKIKEKKLVIALKKDKLMLNENESMKIYEYLQDKIAVENVLTFYSLAKVFKIYKAAKSCFIYIERCFAMLVETQNFLHLNFDHIVEILASSELDIHSEVEVFNAANIWLEHRIEERRWFAKQLLLKVRLTLLSEQALNHLLGFKSTFTGHPECVKTLKENLLCKEKCLPNKLSSYRYCSQNMFSIMTCGGEEQEKRGDTVSEANKVWGGDLEKVEALSPMKKPRREFEAVCLKGEVYVFGGFNDDVNLVKTVEKYSPPTNTWTEIAETTDSRKEFCACAFMDKVFFFGGSCGNDVTNSCLQFDTKQVNCKDNIWKEIAVMKEARYLAACAVFQGNIIVSGGLKNLNFYNSLRTVESYDVFADKWSSMPRMIRSRYYHKLSVVKDKLFVIGQGSDKNFEVFDNIGKQFVVLESSLYIQWLNKSIAIGNKIIIILDDDFYAICYDVVDDKWSYVSCEIARNYKFSSVKLPLY